MLKLKALQSFSVMVTAYQSTRCSIPKDSNLHYDLIVEFISQYRGGREYHVIPGTCLDEPL